MDRTNKLVKIALLAQVIVAAIIIMFFKVEDMTLSRGEVNDFNVGWSIVDENGQERIIDKLPFAGKSEAGEVVTIKAQLPDEYFGKTLYFLSADKELVVRVDGEEIYSFGKKDKRLFGHTPGSVTNFVDMPKDGEGEIEIEMVSPYKDYASIISDIHVADRDVAILHLLRVNLPNLLCSILMVMIGLLLLVLAIMQAISNKDTYGMVYMSLLLIWAGVYYAIETKILQVWYGNQILYSFIVFSFLMCFPILVIMHYIRRVFREDNRIFFWILTASIANVFVQLILQCCNVMDFMDMAVISHVLIGVSVFAIILKFIMRARKKHDRIVWVEMCALLFIGSGSAIDLFRSQIVRVGDFGMFSRYGTLVYGLMILYISIREIMVSLQEEERKRNEETKRQNEELEIARRQAEEANRAKSEFLSQMSHEIRTPINAIVGMNEMILREESDEKILEYAQVVEDSSNALLTIVNDILDISKIESGKMEIVEAEYGVTSLVNDCYNMVAERARNKGLDFEVSCDETVPRVLFGDMIRIRQTIINLLTNAVKYTEKGKVTFLISGKKEDDSYQLKIEVKDTGIGMKPENLEALFDKFERFDLEHNQGIEGTGLGLNITHHLVDMMHGKILVESEYGHGSTFTILLPQKLVNEETIATFSVGKTRNPVERKSYRPRFTAKEAKVLVVDDVPINLKVFASLLSKTQMEIDTASSGIDCLRMTREKTYDIIFLDHMMPVMDGIETLRQLKTVEGNLNRDVPIVMLTANAVAGMKEKYLSEGFTDYLSKPIESDKLEEMLLKYLPDEKITVVQEEKINEDEKKECVTMEEGKQRVPMVEGGGLDALCQSIPEIDMEKALLYCAGSKEFYVEMLGDFSTDGRKEKLEAFYEAEDWDNYAVDVHALKSTARTLGLMHIGDRAEKLQEAAEKKDVSFIKENHGELIEVLTYAVECITKM